MIQRVRLNWNGGNGVENAIILNPHADNKREIINSLISSIFLALISRDIAGCKLGGPRKICSFTRIVIIPRRRFPVFPCARHKNKQMRRIISLCRGTKRISSSDTISRCKFHSDGIESNRTVILRKRRGRTKENWVNIAEPNNNNR